MSNESTIHKIYSYFRPLLIRSGLIELLHKLVGATLINKFTHAIGIEGFNPGKYIDRSAKLRSQNNINYRSDKITGINFVGDLKAQIGLGEATRSIVISINTIPLKLNFFEMALETVDRNETVPVYINSETVFPWTLLYLNAASLDYLLDRIPDNFFKDSYVIAYWFWELPKLPERWHYLFQYLDEIWVASDYVRDCVASVTTIPVTTIPLPINVITSDATRADFNLPDDRKIFLYTFDQGSSVGRKNPFGFIEAFRRAFGQPVNGPLLVLKVSNMNFYKGNALANALQEAVASVNGILFTENLNRIEINNLINIIDCYVSLHRCEGYGLGMAEAMFLGKPVIATKYSGNMKFMNDDNSLLVNYHLRDIVPEDHSFQPYYLETYELGQQWAEPDLDHAAQLMHTIIDNPAYAQKIANNAYHDIRSIYNNKNIGQMIDQRLKKVASANKNI